MKLKVLGSSSAGNGYVFDNGNEALLVECGVAFTHIQKAVDFNVSRFVGALVSHEHGDHTSQIKKVLDARIKCYMSAGTAKALKIEANALVVSVEECKMYKIGNFTVQPFSVQHDAAEPFGFLIHHKEMGTALFATDTYYLKYKFAGLSNILIECNYRYDILEANVEAGYIARPQRDRTIKSHMSFETCREVLLANDLRKVNNIVLIHLSDGNANEKEFKKGIEEATCKTVHIADKDLIIDFNKTTF